MSSSHPIKDNEGIVEKLLLAGRSKDTTKIARLLVHSKRPSSSLHVPLLPSCDVASKLLKDEENSSSIIELLCRVLLLSPTLYETPGEGAMKLVQWCQRRTKNEDSIEKDSMLAIQSFLQQTAASWFEEECKGGGGSSISSPKPHNGRGRTSAWWMQQLAQTIIAPLLDGSDKTSHSLFSGWRIPLQLIPTILTIARDLDRTLFDSLLLDVCLCREPQSRIRNECLVPWFALMAELRLYIRAKDVLVVQERLKHALSTSWCRSHQDGSVGLAESLLAFAEHCIRENDTKTLQTWQGFLLQLYGLVLCDKTTMTTQLLQQLESLMQRHLLAFPLAALQTWVSALIAVERSATIPAHVHALMILQVLHHQRDGSQLVAHLVRRAIHGGGGRTPQKPELFLQCWDCLVRLASCDHNRPKRSIVELKQCHVAYEGRGKFSGGDDNVVESFCRAGSLVFAGLNESTGARASGWIRGVNEALRNDGKEVSVEVAVAVLVTIYCEVPFVRSAIVRDTVKGLEAGGIAAQVNCLFLSILMRHASADETTHRDFGSLAESVLSRSLQLSLFVELVDTFIPIASARPILLKMAHKCCASHDLSNETRNGNWGEEKDQENTDNELQCSLYALAVLSYSADDSQAWKLLSRVLDNDAISLMFNIRSWWFGQLRLLVARENSSSGACQRLLKLCLVHLISFFGPDAQGNPAFCPEAAFVCGETTGTKQVEDVAGLFALVMDLLHCGISVSRYEWKESATSWRLTLFALLDTHSSKKAIDPRIIDASSLQSSCVGYDEQFLCNAALYSLSLVLKTVLQKTVPSTGKYGNHMSVPFPLSLQDLRVLLQQETRTRSNDNVVSRLRPVSQAASPAHALRRDLFVDEPKKVLLFCSNVADAVVEFLVGPRWPWSSRQDLMKPDYCVAERLGVVLSAQRRLRGGSAPGKLSSSPYKQSILDSYNGLLVASTPTLSQSLRDDTAIGQLDDLLLLVVEICEFMAETPMPNLPACWSCIQTLQHVYTLLCTEAACVRLVSYLDNHLCANAELKISQLERQLLVCLRSIDSEDATDKFVRSLRKSMLRAISCSLSSAIHMTKEKIIRTNAMEVAQTSLLLPAGSVRELLRLFYDDIRDGIKGESGGMTFDLLECYLDTVKNACGLLNEGIAVSPSLIREHPGILADLPRLVAVLQDLFALPCLSESSVFKNLLATCTSRIPALARTALRAILCDGGGSPDSGKFRNYRYNLFATRCFLQGASLLSDVAQGGDCLWLGYGEYDDDNSSSCGGQRSSERECSKGSVANAVTGIRYIGNKETSAEVPLLIRSELVWTRTLGTTLQSFEDDIVESSMVLQDDRRVFSSKMLAENYLQWRVNEVRGYIQAIRHSFEKNHVPDQRGKAEMPLERIHVMSLPAHAKKRLCGFFEQFFALLIQATKQVCSMSNSSLKERDTNSQLLSEVEALSCLMSWLSSGSSKEDELTCLVRLWHKCERGMLESSARRGVQTSEDSVLRRLRKVEHRIDELETSIRKLSDVFKFTQRSNVLHLETHLNRAGELVSSQPKVQAFKHMISDKLKIVAEGQLGSHVDGEERGRKRKVTTKMQKRLKRERRQRTIRSRNDVVDKWLQIDKEVGEDEAHGDDAYADLEDFLVDG